MKLYLIRGNDIGGENQDSFVVGEDRQEAVRLWNEQCVENGWARDDNDEGDETGPMDIEPAQVRIVLHDTIGTPFGGAARALEWDVFPIV